MEVVTILIGVVVFIISALMIYCISAFSMREKTFEEVIEEQRRREEAEREKAKAEKKAERELLKKKHKKGKHDKVKEKAAQVTEPELKVETKMVNLEIEPEIIEPTETLGLNAGLKHRGKKEKVAKSILQNKGEHTLVVEKVVELHHKPVVPKDELELKKSHEKVVEKVVVEKIEKQKVVVEKIEKQKVIHTESHHEKETKVKHSAESKENLPPKKIDKEEEHMTKQHVIDLDKRPAKLKAPADDAPINGARLISSVKSANLTDNEVQSLIDILLKKSGIEAADSWNKKSQKGDPTVALKKQLEDRERALRDEQAITVSANSRAKELGNELLAEKKKYEAIEKKLQEKLDQYQAELSAYQQRMQHSHDQHLIETSNLQSKIRALEQGSDKASAHKLTEENKILQDSLNLKVSENIKLSEKLKFSEKELGKSSSSIHAVEAAKKAVESKLNMYEDKIRKLEAAQKEVDSMTHKQVDEVSQELRKAEAKNSNISSDLQKANGALNVAQEEVKTLKAKLQELEAHLTRADVGKETETRLNESEQKRSDLEGNLKNLEKQLAGLSNRLRECETEILKTEKHTTKSVRNRYKKDSEDMDRTGMASPRYPREKGKRLQQENRTLLEENKVVSERLQTAPASNGDIHENGPSIPLAEHEQIVSKKDKEVNEITAGLDTQKKHLLNIQGQLDSKVAEVANLQEQLSQQKQKNDELRAKNWKAMEALEISEKSGTEKVDKALKSARDLSTVGITEIEVYDKTVFQRLFPDVHISDKLAHKEWVTTFEKQALKKTAEKADTSAKPSALTEENSKLRKDLADLKNKVNILTEKENGLIELEEQNKKICKQLSDYEKQFVELNSQNEKLKQVEAENYQLKSSLTATVNDPERYTQLVNDNSRLKSELENYHSIVTETENKLRQLEKTIDGEEKKWQEKLKQAQSHPKEATGSLQRIKELESLVSHQDSQMQEYRSVLSLSEDRLRGLESKVDTEEKRWQENIERAQSELKQTKNTLSSLKQEIQVTQGSQEMETRVAELEDELREAHEIIIVITKEKETVITELSETHKLISGVNTHSSEKDLVEIRTQLESERKRVKDLSLNIVKLNGIIKTGQDALSQEQSLVKKLQESLDSKSVSSGATELDEVDQLRSKLSEKQKLLEREISTNKQLSERLTASTSDSGTSV